ncbi:MAG: DUF5011 domain-containing protein, partial [Bacteroidota bacterium]|nr:DUF5011 domain-containing protein [Bacteroidota bacterium]
MKTIKYFIIIFLGVSLFVQSCTKEDTKDVSTVTTPASITLKGDQTVYVIQGQQYVDSGAVVTNGKLVKTTGSVLTTVPGSYVIKYV